ncbi:MAG TPA: lysophospholipid acyltransferase family protein [Myxococcaceae bacterium]|nr:lysophospholipid acyltransferase family protein [Myxococcaceae bacterium]
MIPAAKSGPMAWLWDRYVGWKFRSTFRGLWVRGVLPTEERPRLVYVNHSNWWDGFALHQLAQAAHWDAYCLMEEKNLRRYRFLTRIGAFSIRPGDAASSLESLRYARQLMRRPRTAMYIFPEGEHRPFGVLPLQLQRGVETLARVTRVDCVPVALRYAFFEHERPDLLVEVGPAHAAGELALFQQNLEAVVRKVASATSLEGFSRVVRGGSGVAERWDAVRRLQT